VNVPFQSRGARRLVLAAIAAAALATTSGMALAQAAWPTKPVKVILPFGPGSATDTVGRSIANELQV